MSHQRPTTKLRPGDIITTGEAAGILMIPAEKVCSLLRARKIPGGKISGSKRGQWRMWRSDVLAYRRRKLRQARGS